MDSLEGLRAVDDDIEGDAGRIERWKLRGDGGAFEGRIVDRGFAASESAGSCDAFT